MKIEIWSDYSCPYCYIGKTTLEQALLDLGLKDKVELIYKAYQLDPHAPKVSSSKVVDDLASKYQMPVNDAQAMLDSLAIKAQAVGLQFNYDILQATSTLDAHRLTKLTPKPQRALLNTQLYHAYFSQGKNLADSSTLQDISQASGYTSEELKTSLSSSAALKEVLADIQEAKHLGITGVPYYRINAQTIIQGAQTLQTFTDKIKEAYLKEIQKLNRE